MSSWQLAPVGMTPKMWIASRVAAFVLPWATLLHLAATECSAKLIVEPAERLTFLAEGMDAAFGRIRTIRADVDSAEIFEASGEPRVDTFDQTKWVSRATQHRFVSSLTQLYDGKAPPKAKPGQRHAPVGERLTECVYSSGLLIEVRPADQKVFIADWRKRPASTLQERARHEPYFYGSSIRGLSLTDLIEREEYWHTLPETIDPMAERRIRWAGKKAYQARETDVIELSVKWTARDGTRYEHCYEILVEPARGFTVPFVTEAYRENGGALQTIQTIETECVEHGADAWGPKKTVCTALFTTPKGRGNSVTTTTLENVRFNTPVADEELMATLADGTMVDDQLAGQYFKYRVVDEPVLLQSIENSCRKAGFVGLIPIARHDTGSVSGDQTRSTPERNGIAKGDSPDRGATPQVRGGSPIKRIGLGVGLCAASLAGLGLLTHVFVAKRRCRPPSGGA